MRHALSVLARGALPGLLLALWLPAAWAGIVVVGHPGLPLDRLSKQQVKAYFLGRHPTFPDGTPVKVFDHAAGEPLRQAFYARVLGKTPQQARAYWARVVFTGKGVPPVSLHGDQAVLERVAQTPGGIGYVDEAHLAAAAGRVKVLWKE